jgi:hypothetical protein
MSGDGIVREIIVHRSYQPDADACVDALRTLLRQQNVNHDSCKVDTVVAGTEDITDNETAKETYDR